MEDKIVIIPVYQPTSKLIEIINKLNERNLRCIVVDDGSTENIEIFEKLNTKTIILKHEKNMGKGRAIKTGLEYILENEKSVTVVGTMDSDGQHLVLDLEKVMQMVNKKNMFVIGARTFDKNIPIKSKIGNILTRNIFKIVTGKKVTDTQSGLRAFSSDLICNLIKIKGERYEYEMNVLLSMIKQKVDIVEVPIKTIYFDLNNSCSHFHAIKDSLRIYKDLIKFSLVSFSSFLVDYIFFFILIKFFNDYAIMCNILARIISAVYNYYLNCRYVFKEKNTLKNVIQYILLAIFILIMNVFILKLYISVFKIYVLQAKILTEITLFIISFLFQKLVIFKKRKE